MAARNFTCEGERVDAVQMRPQGQCGFVTGPAFGVIEVDETRGFDYIRLQVRDISGKVRLESILSQSAGHCNPLPP